MGWSRLDLKRIDRALRRMQSQFDRINASLDSPRDPLTDEVRENLHSGYAYIDELLADRVDLFKRGNSARLLEINARVLCGTSERQRRAARSHIASTEKHFYANPEGGVEELVALVRELNGSKVWRTAASAYVQVLSQPQLFLEGNHRSGALIMSFLLARDGKPPFVLSPENAKSYFDPSSTVKSSRKRTLKLLLQRPKLIKDLASLLQESAQKSCLR